MGMTREKRDELLTETKELMNQYREYVGTEMMTTEYVDDVSIVLMVKTMKTCTALMDYALFQAHQIDRLEDMNRSILNEIRKISRKKVVD